MKKVLLAIAIVLAMGFGAYAQQNGNDNLFNNWNDVTNDLDEYEDFDMIEGGFRDGEPGLPGGHGQGDTPAPLGSGLVILGALGAGYAFLRKKEE